MVRTLALLVLTFAFAGCLQTAHACSLARQNERVDVFVLYGQVVAHVEDRLNGKPAWGIEIAPRHELRMIARSANGFYKIYPTQPDTDCSDIPVPTREEIEDRFPLGSIVQIVGQDAAASGRLGDIATHHWGVLAPLPAGCNVDDAARVEHDYRNTAPACGDYRFEANKDLARLDFAAPQERNEILARLAAYAHGLDYAALIGTHVPDPNEGERLLRLRYGDLTDEDCLADAQLRRTMDADRVAKLVERCAQRNPYASPDRWNLYEAIGLGRLDVVEDYLRNGGNAKAPIMGTPMGAAIPLEVAVRARHDDVALALLEAGAELDATGLEIEDVIDTALPKTLRWLLANDVAYRDRVPDFSFVCRNGRYELIDIVLDHARARRLDASAVLAETVITCISRRTTDIARALLERGAPITDDTLLAAATAGSPGITRLVLERGANPKAIYRVSRRGREERGTAMDVVWRDYELRPPEAQVRFGYVLHELAAAGGTLSGGELPNGVARDGSAEIDAGRTPDERLIVAARIGFYDVVERLLAVHDFAATPLTEAARAAIHAGNPEIARRLIAAGADSSDGLLHAAVGGNHTGLIVDLAERDVDFNALVNGKSALAVWHEQPSAATNYYALLALKFGGADFCAFLAAVDTPNRATPLAQSVAPECTAASR